MQASVQGPAMRVLSVSLRAAEGVDVSVMAEQFGGGGHLGAAAFRCRWAPRERTGSSNIGARVHTMP
ncbi:hypothetical protein PPGU19_096520 (plasmid) [Paraburkholderia sp. PGU19]|nr:hypothetical protein PPGU19_096520 [Paraburkholderia sp. PGU19]